MSRYDSAYSSQSVVRIELIISYILSTHIITFTGFARYLLSKEGEVCNPNHSRVNQDMSQPLSHYYIASSHNTYLVGDQLMSQSSVDVYAMVLQAGCRCVESKYTARLIF